MSGSSVIEPGQNNSASGHGPSQPGLPKAPPRASKLASSDPVTPETFAAKIQALPDTLQVFLDHDFEAKRDNVKNMQYYHVIMYYFNPGTAARTSHRKSKLQETFDKEVKPLIQPYIRPPPVVSEPMQTDDPPSDFNPLSRKTKRSDIVAVILKKTPGFIIPENARIDQLLWLYKSKVDPDLMLPKKTEFSQIPHPLALERVEKATTEELRHALQGHAPHIFVHSIALNSPCLVNLYIQFVLEGQLPANRVPVLGFHYAIIDDE